MRRVDVAYALIFDVESECVLMVNNIGGAWSLPGGAVEKGETLAQAAIREVAEETGLTVKLGNVVAINEAFVKKHGNHALFITFEAVSWSGECEIKFGEEIAEIKWVDVHTANKLMPYFINGVEGLLQSSIAYNFQT